jgi:hypothetical protein
MRTELWLKNLKETDHSEGLDIGGRIILKLILGNCVLKCSLDSSGSGQVWVMGTVINLRSHN